jgi:hypothetical protein
MSKYNIEGGIDFFSELYKSLDFEDNKEKTDADNNLCLITGKELEDKYVKLDCSHKFNYIPLYNDIKNHKQKFNSLEGNNSRLKINEIRCPYCRNKQIGVLPYYPEFGLKKINGVNFYDATIQSSENYLHKKYPKCCFLIPNMNYVELSNINSETDNTVIDENSNALKETNIKNNKFIKCNYTAYYDISNYISNFENEKIHYCYEHKNKIVSEYKKKIKEDAKKVKEDAKLQAKKEKEDAKLQAKKEKEDAKLQAKKEKEATKLQTKKIQKNKEKKTEKIIEELQNINDENQILENIDNINIEQKGGCIGIIKTGPKKGEQCGCLTINNQFMCKKHYNIYLKNEIVKTEK